MQDELVDQSMFQVRVDDGRPAFLVLERVPAVNLKSFRDFRKGRGFGGGLESFGEGVVCLGAGVGVGKVFEIQSGTSSGISLMRLKARISMRSALSVSEENVSENRVPRLQLA